MEAEHGTVLQHNGSARVSGFGWKPSEQSHASVSCIVQKSMFFGLTSGLRMVDKSKALMKNKGIRLNLNPLNPHQ